MTDYQEQVTLTGQETPLERAEAFRRAWERRAKKLFKACSQALIAADAGDAETAAEILARALNK